LLLATTVAGLSAARGEWGGKDVGFMFGH